ncbi:MAG: hypothetical protein MZV65_35620 [Chromatiales bacterium]|nr:hypothetical protein [Chromatiales bacterium]
MMRRQLLNLRRLAEQTARAGVSQALTPPRSPRPADPRIELTWLHALSHAGGHEMTEATGNVEPRSEADLAHLPSPPRASLLEAAWALPRMRREPLTVWSHLYQKHGPVVCQQGLGVFDVYCLFGPEANRFLMLDREDVFSARRSWMMIMGRIFPNGLLLRDGEDHRHHRKTMQVAFKTPALQDYASRMNAEIDARPASAGAASARDSEPSRPSRT